MHPGGKGGNEGSGKASVGPRRGKGASHSGSGASGGTRQPGLSTLEVNLSALFPLLIFSPLG